jgi:MFS family permease
MRERKIYIDIFLGVTFLFWTTLYLYVPTLPTYIKSKVINLSMVGFVLSMYGLCQLIFRLPLGIAVDATGRGKPFIIAGLSLAALGAFILGRGNSMGMLAVGRSLTGIGAATWVPLLVVFSTFFSAEEAIFSSSMLTLTANLGRVAGSSLTGILNRIGGYALPFYLSVVTGTIAFGIASFLREEKSLSEGISLQSIGVLFARKDVIIPAVISILVHHVDYAITFSFLPIFAQEMGASDVVKSLIISLNLAAVTVANLVNTVVLRRMRHNILLLSGSFLYFCGIIVISFASKLSFLFYGTILMGIAFGIVYPILLGMSIHKVDRSQRNTAMGIHQSFYSIGMWTGPWVTGIIAGIVGIQKTFLITGGFYLITVYLLIYILLRKKDSEHRICM